MRIVMRFLKMSLLAVLGLVAGMFFPEPAQAWGPGAHMVMGDWVLRNAGLLPVWVAEPLLRFPGLFLHGCLSADIFIGKGSVAKKGHSHNWESGLALLDKAGTTQRKAYAYGYLAHLAADTVAHGVYVPYLMPASPGNGKMAHVYIEMQADRMLAWSGRHALSAFRQSGSRDVSRMLWKTLRKNPFKFKLQSGVYQGSIAVGGSALWRRSLDVMDRVFPGHVRADTLDAMLAAATRAVVDVLRKGEASPVFSLDPIGETALAEAASARSARGFFLSRAGTVPAFPPALPDALQSLPAVPSAQPKVAA